MTIRWIDLSQPIYNGMPRAGLLDVPKLTPKQIDIGQPDMTVQITDMSFATHTGTHIDAPLHFFPGGKAPDDLIIEHLNLERLSVAPRMTVAAFPLPIRGADGAPARVFAMVEESP